MKKAVIIAILGLLTLVSCSNDTNSGEQSVSITEATTKVTTEPETTTTDKITSTEKITSITSNSDEDPWSKYEYHYIKTFDEPIICHDDENISIKCLGWAVADDYFSGKFEIENKMDTNIILRTTDTSINDYDIDIFLYDTITAGKKKILYAQSDDNDIQVCSFTGKDITKTEFCFKIINEDTLETIFKTDNTVIPVEQV